MSDIQTLRDKLGQASTLVKEAVDITAGILKDSDNKEVTALWEDFLKEFLSYIRLKSKEIKKNLLASIKFGRIWQ